MHEIGSNELLHVDKAFYDSDLFLIPDNLEDDR